MTKNKICNELYNSSFAKFIKHYFKMEKGKLKKKERKNNR